VAAGAINQVDPKEAAAMQIAAVTNPFAAEGGRDAEPLDRIREMAPQAFRATQFRAVRPEDYEQAAATLPWVQRAGTTFRYTGSWLTVFTAVDPKGMETVPPGLDADLTGLLNRYRLAGYESFTVAPRFASLDLDITVCVRPDAFRGEVREAVRAALDANRHADGSTGFFHPDRFTFGVALERSAIEAAVQEVPGVDGVIDVRYRRRGHTPGFVKMPDFVPVAPDEIVRVDDAASRPEHGSLRIETVGGK
jgi:predicted phage baseplate assembly protein